MRPVTFYQYEVYLTYCCFFSLFVWNSFDHIKRKSTYAIELMNIISTILRSSRGNIYANVMMIEIILYVNTNKHQKYVLNFKNILPIQYAKAAVIYWFKTSLQKNGSKIYSAAFIINTYIFRTEHSESFKVICLPSM